MNNYKLGYFLQKNWRELLSLIIAIITAFIAFNFSSQPGTIFWLTVISTIIFSILTLYFHLREKDFYFIALDDYANKEDWFGSGKFEFDKTNTAYIIADTDAGFIFSKSLLWKDYSFKGEFKILKRCLGVILRAKDLSNYVMLQIQKDSIRPHIRANGGYVAFETKNTGLTFEENIKDGDWCKFELIVKGEDIETKIIRGKKIIINKSWKIPSGNIAIPVFNKKDEKRKSLTHVFDITISYDYGSIGFRNGHGERALVKNLLVKSINNH